MASLIRTLLCIIAMGLATTAVAQAEEPTLDAPAGSTGAARAAAQDPALDARSQWQALAVDYVYWMERLAAVAKYYEDTAVHPSRLSAPHARRRMERKTEEEAAIRASLAALQYPAGRDAEAVARDTARLLGQVDTLRVVAASRLDGTGPSASGAVEAYAGFHKDLLDTLARLRAISELDLNLDPALALTPRAALEAAGQWREFLDRYSPLARRLYRVAGSYLNASLAPTRAATPEFQAIVAEEAAARAALSRLPMPLLPGRNDAQRDVDQVLAALDGLRTTASSPAIGGSTAPTELDRALRAIDNYGEFTAAAMSSLDRLRVLSDPR